MANKKTTTRPISKKVSIKEQESLRTLNLWAGIIPLIKVIAFISFIVLIGISAGTGSDGVLWASFAPMGVTFLLGIATLVLGVIQIVRNQEHSNSDLMIAAGVFNILSFFIPFIPSIIGAVLSLMSAAKK